MNTKSTDTGASPAPSGSPEIVPFHEAEIEAEGNHYRSAKATLEGDRTIELGYAENGDRYVQIERPIEGGKRSRLAFGLHEDAAAALTHLLCLSFEENNPLTLPQGSVQHPVRP